MKVWASTNEQHIWVSALTNHMLIDTLCTKDGSNSIMILAERIAKRYFNIPDGRMSTAFQPIYNPQDARSTAWPELLGWLITVGTMTQVER